MKRLRGELARLEELWKNNKEVGINVHNIYHGLQYLLRQDALSIPDLNERALALAKAMGKKNLVKKIEQAAFGHMSAMPDEVIKYNVFNHAYKDKEGKVNDLKTWKSVNKTDKRFHELSEGDREAAQAEYEAQEIAKKFEVDIQSHNFLPEAFQPYVKEGDIMGVSPMVNEKENVTNEWVKILCEKYPDMHGLNLQGCTQVTDITPLSSLQNLFELDLDGTNVTDLSPLLDLPKLLGLSVNTNIISNQKIREFQEAYQAKYGRRVDMPYNYENDEN